MKLLTNYKEEALYRKSFNELTKQTFGIQFEEWYQKGFWNDRYIPYSFIDGDKVVANVSVNLFDMVINEETVKALQIGTVMTHPDYRNKGLSSNLMYKVFEDFEKTCDFMYLFANQSVLDFYPKFGFNSYQESLFEYTLPCKETAQFVLKKLNPTSENDLDFIYELHKKRAPISRKFGVVNSEDVFMFHTMYGFEEDLYFVPELEAIIIFLQKEDAVHIFDIVCEKELSLDALIPKIVPMGIKRVILHFTPSTIMGNIKAVPYEPDDVLFIQHKSNITLPRHLKHPNTSQA